MASVFTRDKVLTATTASLLAGPRRVSLSGQPPSASGRDDLGSDLALISGAAPTLYALAKADGVLLVDGGAAQHSAALQRVLGERWPGRRVEIRSDSNWREEHTGANAALRAAGATIWRTGTQALARRRLSRGVGGPALRAASRCGAAEQDVLTSRATSSSAACASNWHCRGRTPRRRGRLLWRRERARRQRSLVSGPLSVPDYSTGGSIGGLFDATQALLERTDARTRVIAATGGVYGRTELEAQLAMLTAVRSKIAEAFRVGHGREDFIAAKPTAEFDAQWGDPQQFLPLVYKGGFRDMRELGGVI